MQTRTGGHFRARFIDSTLADIRFAVRHAVRKPLMALTIVGVLSIGIGVHSAVYSVLQTLTTRTAPGIAPDDALVHVRGKEQLQAGGKWFPRDFSYIEYQEIAQHREVFAAVTAWTEQTLALDLADGNDAGTVNAQFVTANFFSALGVRPLLGSGLPAFDEAAQGEPVLQAVIGHRLWELKFGASPSVIGSVVRFNNIPVQIVGVAPRQFNGATPSASSQTVWLPLSARMAILRTTRESLTSRDSVMLQSIARLQPGAAIQQADAVVRVVASRSVAQMKIQNGPELRTADVVSLRGDTTLPVSDDAVMVVAVFGSIAMLILLITCTNVSALVVGAATTRRQEIAVRLSLGASRARVVRQLMTESIMMALVAGALGLALYWALVTFFASRVPQMNLTPDFGTAVFTLCFALGTGILFGLSPALHATRGGYSETLKQSGSGGIGRSRLQRAFVVAQIVFTQPLLAGLAMMLALVVTDSTARVNEKTAEQIVAVQFHLMTPNGVTQSSESRNSALRQAVQTTAATFGAIAVVSEPFGIANANFTVLPSDRGAVPDAGNTISVHVEAASPGYFAMLNIPIVQGRELSVEDFNARDLPVVIDSDLAKRMWGNASAVGKKFTQANANYNTPQREAVVVGVYDARFPTTRGAGTRVYSATPTPLASSYLIRMNGNAKLQLASLRAAFRADIPTISIGSIATLADINAESEKEVFRISTAAAGAGLLVLLLASIGLYGVVALALGQRRREIGVRLALGAKPQQVVGMLFSGGVKLSLLGLVIGLPISMVVVRVLAQQAKLPNINLTLVGAGVAMIVISVASLATWLPARHAAQVDPVASLRAD